VASGAATLDVVPVTEPKASWGDALRAVRVVWKRELIRWSRNRTRILTTLVQPVLFLFVLGSGLASLLPRQGGGLDFRTFMFPGVLAMVVLFTSIFSAVSIVWDREFGFMREMMVAPVPRSALVIGKCLGGATVATIQGTILLSLAGLVHVPYNPVLIVTLLAEMALTAFTLTSFGVFAASRMQQVESFQVVMQLFVFPMFFLSGAVFPLTDLPRWLDVLTKIDPLTYAVDAIRRAILSHVPLGPGSSQLAHPLTWGHWVLPTGFELGIVAAVGLALIGGAIAQFSRAE
jgi:ABC-2 type transport system permease protein